MTRNGAYLKLPNGNEYEFTEDLIVDESQNPNPLYDSNGGQFVAIAERVSGSGGSSMQSTIVGLGAGRRQFDIEAVVYEGSTDTFGNASAGDSAATKVQHLMRDLASTVSDSNSVSTFEWREYSSSGQFEALSVVPLERDADVNFRESASEATVRLSLVEATNTSEVVDGVGDPINDLFIKPLTNATPKLPLPLDTLGNGTKALPHEIAESGLVDTAGSAASPITEATKILPGGVQIRGAFRGANATDLAATMRKEIVHDPNVDAVEVVADQADVAPELTGEWTLGPDTSLDPIDPRIDGIYGFDLDLRQR